MQLSRRSFLGALGVATAVTSIPVFVASKVLRQPRPFDDAAWLQRMINAAFETHTPLHVPKGKYRIGRTLILPECQPGQLLSFTGSTLIGELDGPIIHVHKGCHNLFIPDLHLRNSFGAGIQFA